MEKELKKAMMTSISEVMETMFFMSLEINANSSLKDSGLFDGGQLLFVSGIEFAGPFTGSLKLVVPETILQDMAQDFMGLNQDEITDEHLNGTIQELTNMIAGSTFSAYDDQAVFKLGIPHMIDQKDVPGMAEIKDENSILVETPDGFLALQVLVK